MKNLVFLNIKGGVGKTTSALAFAMILANEHNKKVLLVDADQQGNSTLALGHESTDFSTAELLLAKDIIGKKAVVGTEYGIDLIGAGFGLMSANRSVLIDASRPQQFRFRRQFKELEESYDYCVFDCPPDITMAAVNALAIADDVLIPIRADRYGFDGLSFTTASVENIRELNSKLRIAGAFLTMTQKGTRLSADAYKRLQSLGLPYFQTSIRTAVKVGESTFNKPLMSYAPRSAVAEDYRALVNEYLEKSERR